MAGRVIVPVPARAITTTVALSGLQAAINAATAPAKIVVTAGSYSLGATITPKTNVWIIGDGATINPNGHMVFSISGQSNVWISGFTINGIPTDSPINGLVNISGGANDIHIVNNAFLETNGSIVTGLASNLYVQGNYFQNSSTDTATQAQAISPRSSAGQTIDMQVFSDNELFNMTRFGIETVHAGTVTNFHCDRNLIHGAGASGLSIIGDHYNSGTIWGNEIHHRTSSFSGGIEIGHGPATALTISNNYIHDNPGAGIVFASCPGTVCENNTLDGPGAAMVQEPGYDGTEWVGVNTINGVQVTGWSPRVYGAKPATFAPSSSPAVTGPGQLFFGATEIQHVYLGTTEIKKIYLGNILLFDVTGGAPPGEATADSTSITADSTARTADET